jgi:hypothetical protein
MRVIMRPWLMVRSANIGSVLASREMKNFDIPIRITYSYAKVRGIHDSRIGRVAGGFYANRNAKGFL